MERYDPIYLTMITYHISDAMANLDNGNGQNLRCRKSLLFGNVADRIHKSDKIKKTILLQQTWTMVMART